MNVTTVNIFRCDLRLARTPSLSHYYGLNDWMPQIPEGTGHRSQRDMINSCSHAQWP